MQGKERELRAGDEGRMRETESRKTHSEMSVVSIARDDEKKQGVRGRVE